MIERLQADAILSKSDVTVEETKEKITCQEEMKVENNGEKDEVQPIGDSNIKSVKEASFCKASHRNWIWFVMAVTIILISRIYFFMQDKAPEEF